MQCLAILPVVFIGFISGLPSITYQQGRSTHPCACDSNREMAHIFGLLRDVLDG